jgi:polyisoprenoid-binding protein YceI
VTPARVRDHGRAIALLLISALTLATARSDAEPLRWMTVAGKSSVSFDASFAFGDFSGRTEEVVGEFTADPSDLRQGISGALRVNAASLRTGVQGRDRDMWRTLAAARDPEIRFTVRRVEVSFPSITDRSDVLLTITGVMRIHGVERPMLFPGRVRLRDGQLWVRGESPLKMSDFAIKPPRRFFVRVSDSVLVSFDLLLSDR